MNNAVQKFLEKKRQELNNNNEKTKNDYLISLGLYEKIYSPDNKYSKEFNFSEWDTEAQINRWFKKIVFDVTDEEFEEIKKLCGENKNTSLDNSNPVATALTVIAILIFLCGFIAGIVLGNVEVGSIYTHTEFSFAIAFTYWAISFISGIMMLGFAEIIKLLTSIKNK